MDLMSLDREKRRPRNPLLYAKRGTLSKRRDSWAMSKIRNRRRKLEALLSNVKPKGYFFGGSNRKKINIAPVTAIGMAQSAVVPNG
jgi:hypothetical protein